jgi:hypothetical protein
MVSSALAGWLKIVGLINNYDKLLTEFCCEFIKDVCNALDLYPSIMPFQAIPRTPRMFVSLFLQ